MKRGAERQLTKDGPGEDEDEDEDVEETHAQGFQKADESALATRQIRALPKRALAASRPPSLNGVPPALASDTETSEAVPKFGGFVGFGAGTSASNPFTFTAQQPPASAFTPSAPGTAFRHTQSTSASPFFGAPTSLPVNADTSLPKPAASSPVDETDAVAFKYFKSLRGLNVSFLSAISAAVEKDPFFDVANLVESYKNLRTTIQSEFDRSPQPFTAQGSVTTNSTPLFGAKVPSDKTTSLFSMPKPPSGSAEASSKLPSTSESGTRTTFLPFVPPSSSAPTQAPFGLTSKLSDASSSTTPEPPKSAFTFPASKKSALSSSTLPTPGFSFAVPPTVENAASKSVPRSSSQESEGSSAISLSRPASAAPGFGSSSMPSFFVPPKPTSAFGTTDAASKPMSVFGGSIFGGGSATEFNRPSLVTPPPSDNKDTPKEDITLLGKATSSTNIFGSDKPTSFFGSASPPKTGAFTFGKPGGSIGNPVGFGFGSSAPSAGDATGPRASAPGFSFGVPSSKPSESLFSPPMTDKSTESTPQPDAECNEEGGEEEATKLLPSHTHDEEGEGEEDEETTHAVRCKVYRLSKSENKSEWKDLGVGMFRLKKHKVTNVRRALMRNSNTGRILVNFRVYEGLKPSLAKTSISFIGYEDNVPTSFRVRVKTEEQAGELKLALEREIAAVQATE